MMILVLYVICSVVHAQLGVALCSTYGTQTPCDASGYCRWSGSCLNLDCYLVTEAAACRTMGGNVGSLTSICSALDEFSIQYDNVCKKTTETKLNFGFARFAKQSTGTATSIATQTGVPVATLTTTTSQAQYTFQLYTLNIQTATSTQLGVILDAYYHFQNELTTTTAHPFYQEKAIYQTLQNIRDDFTMTDPIRQGLLTKLWLVTDVLQTRLRTYSSYYQTTYYFVGFASATISRLSMTVKAQDTTITMSWTTYADNGFVQIISLHPAQFGIDGAKSDIVMISTKKTDGTALSTPLQFKLTWTWTDAAYTAGTVKLFAFNKLTAVTTDMGAVTCTQPSKKCETVATLTIATQQNYFFAETLAACPKSSSYCRLAFCGGCPAI